MASSMYCMNWLPKPETAFGLFMNPEKKQNKKKNNQPLC